MSFIKDLWYVAAWASEVQDRPEACAIIGEALVLYRRSDGSLVAMEDRCPHRHAPLSLGRVEGDDIRCMYHGMQFNPVGRCIGLPGSETIPNAQVRVYPVVEQAGWIWVWIGDPAKADPALIPAAFGTTNPEFTMSQGKMDYDADYQLLNDNLCDLKHLEFVHEKTLGALSKGKIANASWKVVPTASGLSLSNWAQNNILRPGGPKVDMYSAYTYDLPGIFVMSSKFFPAGTAAAEGFEKPGADPILERVEQQAVTPTGPKRTRYFFATGVPTRFFTPGLLESVKDVVDAAFLEDRTMIEAQQRVWDRTGVEKEKLFIPQDKAPFLLRQQIAKRLAAEA